MFAGNTMTGVRSTSFVKGGKIQDSAKDKTNVGGYLRDSELADGKINPFGPGADTPS
jgi:hypothetical protein